MHRFLLHNAAVRDTRENFLSPGQVGVLNGWGVFSTLRVSQGVLFAWERHWARMVRDAQRMHVPLPADSEGLKRDLLELVAANQAENSTLRVAVLRNKGGQFEGPGIERPYEVIAFTKDLAQWKPGVRLMTQAEARHGRSPFAGAKVLSWSMNLTWLETARQAGFDEMLLLDDRGLVSECTSANVFAVFGKEVVTPSLRSGCLPGITREILLEEIRVPGVRIVEADLELKQMQGADEVFITSSTRDLLAVAEIDDVVLSRGDGLSGELTKEFRSYISTYVEANRLTAV